MGIKNQLKHKIRILKQIKEEHEFCPTMQLSIPHVILENIFPFPMFKLIIVAFSMILLKIVKHFIHVDQVLG